MSVFIKSIGLVTAFGKGLQTLWDGLMENRCMTKDHAFLNYHGCKTLKASCVPRRIIEDFGSSAHGDRTDKTLAMMRIALQDMLDAQGLAMDRLEDTLLVVSTLKGHIEALPGSDHIALPSSNVSGHLLSHHASALAGLLPSTVGVKTVSTACASGNIALAVAAQALSNGKCSRAVVVGCDAVSLFVFSGFQALGAMSKHKCRPFDQHRDGLLLGEGAASLLLETGAGAHKGEILSWGITNDANHITGPSRTGEGLQRAIHECLKRADICADSVDAVVAHGTGTHYNDAMEMYAFKSVFGETVPRICSLKGAIGHTLGAAGIIETALAAEILKRAYVPPTVGWSHSGRDRFEYGGGPVGGKYVLNCNSGFGGVNAALLLGKKNDGQNCKGCEDLCFRD